MESSCRNYLTEKLKEILSRYYDIGELTGVTRLDGGCVNLSYEIDTVKGGTKRKYFLRRYKRGIREEEVRFEHSIVNHLKKKDFPPAAGLILRTDGSSYVKDEEIYYAIFEFLSGEDKYTWDNPSCSDEELKNAAGALARYHGAVYDLKPEGRRYDPKIIDLLPTIAGNLMKYARRVGTTKFDNYFLKHLDYALAVIDDTLDRLDRDEYAKMPHLTVHCDYHPGNLKFKNSRVVGLFDLDWAKIDVRCFDLALAVTYFCTTWEGKEDGDLLPERMRLFLASYQAEARKTESPGPLLEKEIECLPLMIKASNLYVLNWAVDDYYIKKLNPYEYLIYLQHNVRFMRWLENNWNSLVDTVGKSL